MAAQPPSQPALVEQLRSHYQSLQQANTLLHYWREHYTVAAEAQQQARLAEQEQALADAFTAARAQGEAQAAQVQQDFDCALAQVRTRWAADQAALPATRRWATLPWDDPAWAHYAPPTQGPVPAAVRLGELDLDATAAGLALPALAPLPGDRHLLLLHTGDTLAAAQALLQSIVLRLVLASPLRSVQLVLLEPGKAGETLSAFLHLPPTLRSPKVVAKPEEVTQQLTQLGEHIEAVVQSRLRNLYATAEEYNAANPANPVPYRIVVVAGVGHLADERQWQALVQIARSGPRAGVYLVGTLDEQTTLPRAARADDLVNLANSLRWHGQERPATWADQSWGAYAVRPDAAPPAAVMNGWLEAIEAALDTHRAVLAFGQIALPPTQQWQGRTQQGLAVPVGIDASGKPYHFRLNSTGSEIVAHGLIGGAPGSGKSNFLHVLITQLALAYPPDELELYLIDFREGVEFQDYAALPHARVLGIECEREFALSILQRLAAEIEHRGERFKQAHANSPEEYRQATGTTLPRTLLIIDEFQRLFEPDDALAREAGRLLELLVRIGRGFGIHVLLSSQAPSTLALQSHRLYDQMIMRLAFRCTETVCAAILGAGNTAATALTQSGDAISNDRLGDRSANRQVRVAFFPSAERRAYLATVAQLAAAQGVTAHPLTFQPRAPANLAANPAVQAALAAPGWTPPLDPVQVWLGEPIALKGPAAAVLQRQDQSNLLIVGREEAPAVGLLAAALAGLAAQHSPDQARFVVADFADPLSSWCGLFPQLAAALPHRVEVFTPASDLFAELDLAPPRPRKSIFDDAPAGSPSEPSAPGSPPPGSPLDAAEQLVQRRLQGQPWADNPQEIPHLYFVVAGLHLWLDLVADRRETTPRARQLLFLAHRGPKVGVHLLAWVDRPGLVEQMLRNALKLFDWRVALQMDEDDSRLLLDSLAAARLGDQRALLYYGRRPGDPEKFKPYHIPSAPALATVTQAIRTKSEGARYGG